MRQEKDDIKSVAKLPSPSLAVLSLNSLDSREICFHYDTVKVSRVSETQIMPNTQAVPYYAKTTSM